MPTKERARSTQLSATTVPCAARWSRPSRVRMTTSAPSPLRRRSRSPSVGAKSASMRAPPSASYRPARLRTAPIKASVESRRTTFSIGDPSSRFCRLRRRIRDQGPTKRNDSPKRSGALADQVAARTPPVRAVCPALGRSRLGGRRHGRDRLHDLGNDLVGVALRVRAAIFQIALVTVVGEAVRYADRGAAVSNTIRELVDRSGLVLAGQPQMVIRAIDRDVIFAGSFERLHQLLEIFLAADFAHVGGGEVGGPAGAVPVGVA